MKLLKLVFFLSLIFFSFHVFGAEADGGEQSIGVTTVGSCEVGTPTYEVPGNITTGEEENGESIELNVIGQNATSTFYFSFVNWGNKNATLDVNLSVTNGSGAVDHMRMEGLVNESFVNSSYEPFEENLSHYIPNEEDATAIGNTYKIHIKDFVANYGVGQYTGRLNVNYTCEGMNITKEYDREKNFRIVQSEADEGGAEEGDQKTDVSFPADANETGEESNTTAPQDANETGEESNTTVPEESNLTGNFTSNITTPADANETGEESNQTVPQDANQTGEESNQTVPQNVTQPGEEGPPLEGNNDNPGQTPEPEPEPEPEPGDSPEPGESDQPRLEIDLEPTNLTYEAFQGQYAPAELQVENLGEREVTDIQLLPQIEDVREGWQSRNASIANLSVNETVRRDVFVRPPEDQRPGDYLVPVVAANSDRQLDLDYFTVKVKQSEFAPRVSIQEAPRTVTATTGENQSLPVLIENAGMRELTNVTAELQNAEDCGDVSASTVSRVDVNGTESMQVDVQTGEDAQSCSATMIVSSEEGAYAFSDVQMDINPDEGLIPQEQEVPLVAIVWTFLLAGYAIMRKRYELTSSVTQLPFFLLLMGETVIILFMLVNYYGVVSASFLPF